MFKLKTLTYYNLCVCGLINCNTILDKNTQASLQTASSVEGNEVHFSARYQKDNRTNGNVAINTSSSSCVRCRFHCAHYRVLLQESIKSHFFFFFFLIVRSSLVCQWDVIRWGIMVCLCSRGCMPQSTCFPDSSNLTKELSFKSVFLPIYFYFIHESLTC